MPSQRTVRTVFRAGAALTLLTCGAIALGFLRPATFCRGRYAIGIDGTYLQLAVSSEAIVRRGPGWKLGPGGQMVLGPLSRWRPAVSSARASITSPLAPPTVYTIDVLYIPLVPWLVLIGATTGVFWWLSRRYIAPGHCRRCAYDLRGLTTDRCPECGGPVQGDIARLVSSMVRLKVLASHHLSLGHR